MSWEVFIVIIITAIEFSLGGSSPYTNTDKTNNIFKRNSTKTQYKQHKTVNTSTRITKTTTHNKTNTSTHPHFKKLTHAHTHTLQNKLK